MDITVNRSDLAKTLSAVGKVIEHRQTIPILGNVLLSADGGLLTVVGNDLDIEISACCACEGGDGETTVDARRLSDIAKRMAGDTVRLAIKDSNLIVKSGRSRFTLPTLPAGDYPRLEAGSFEAEFSVNLVDLVAPVKFAISNEQTRIYLNGIFLHAHDKTLRAVATDGHRLAHNSAPSVGAIPSVIIPSKTVGLIPAGAVDVSLSKNKIHLATADTIIVSKLIDATFPDYQRVIPSSNSNIVIIDRKSLADAVVRASAVASERGRAAKFTIAGDNIAIDMRADDGTAHEDVPATYSGEPIEIGFNCQYMGDVLAAVPGESVSISLADSGTPAIFRGDGDVLALCMPMRV
jgi:DNA polymerase-3 subunit beta